MTDKALGPATNQRVEEIRARLAPTDEDVEAIEEDVSMGHGAWDMVNPKEIIAAAWNRLRLPLDQLERGHYSYLQTLCTGQEIKVKEADVRLAEMVAKLGAFTVIDVAVLEEAAETSEIELERIALRSLASRIADLLPPKSPI